MPQRYGQNPIRASRIADHQAPAGTEGSAARTSSSNIAGICASCKTEVPMKPGFRPSSLRCPKCGKSLGKK
jgi:hypothetical protein